jgi:hypothetical protein
MPYFVIKGTFHVVGYSPDGDTLRFQAHNRDNWKKLSGPPAQINAREHASLRFEGVDAIETHFQGQHGPLDLARAARDFVLKSVGIRNVVWDAREETAASADDGTEGYIISRVVEKNHRAVSFVYTGAAPAQDGEEFFLKPAQVRKSINFQLLKRGLAYPTYYQTLFPDLRDELTRSVEQARAAKAGIYPVDTTNSGATITGLPSITDDNVILPKLFRRLVTFLEGGGTSIAGFPQFLADNPDPLLILSTGHFTNLDTIIKVNGDQVKMTVPPEGLVFDPQVTLSGLQPFSRSR